MRTPITPSGSRDAQEFVANPGEQPASRRINHGGAAWSRQTGIELRQPQDGAPSGARDLSTFLQPGALAREGEDARITGGTRSLMRRLLGLNVTSTLKRELARDWRPALSGSSLPALAPALSSALPTKLGS